MRARPAPTGRDNAIDIDAASHAVRYASRRTPRSARWESCGSQADVENSLEGGQFATGRHSCRRCMRSGHINALIFPLGGLLEKLRRRSRGVTVLPKTATATVM